VFQFITNFLDVSQLLQEVLDPEQVRQFPLHASQLLEIELKKKPFWQPHEGGVPMNRQLMQLLSLGPLQVEQVPWQP
jgi:hypothetical protein